MCLTFPLCYLYKRHHYHNCASTRLQSDHRYVHQMAKLRMVPLLVVTCMKLGILVSWVVFSYEKGSGRVSLFFAVRSGILRVARCHGSGLTLKL